MLGLFNVALELHRLYRIKQQGMDELRKFKEEEVMIHVL